MNRRFDYRSTNGPSWNPGALAHRSRFLGHLLRSQRGPEGYVRSDERIRKGIHERILDEHYINASDVTIQVKDGEVILDGTVTDRRTKYAIEDIAANCHGVRDVHNRIRVAWLSADLLRDKPREFDRHKH